MFGLFGKSKMEKEIAKALKMEDKKAYTRNFEAAVRDRHNNYRVNDVPVDASIKTSLSVLRGRSRNNVRNCPYTNKFLSVLEQNVVGSGKGNRLKCLFKNGDKLDPMNEHIEDLWESWSRDPEVSGRFPDFSSVQRVVIRTVATDGEIFIRVLRGDEFGKFKFQLQLIESEYVCENLNQEPNNHGHYIKMGIKYNQYGRPLSYFFKTDHKPNVHVHHTDLSKMVEIPAHEIIHVYRPLSSDQSRGIPWTTATMSSLGILKGYTDSELKTRRASSCKMGVIEQKDPELDFRVKGDIANASKDDKEENESVQNINQVIEPASFQYLGPGESFKTLDWTHDASYPEFCKQILRQVASALNVGYNVLNNDLEGVNYSSLRSQSLQDQDNYSQIQTWLITSFIEKVYRAWLETVVSFNTKGVCKIAIRDLDKYLYPNFIGRKWQSVDPLKSVKANALAVKMGFASRAEVVRQSGGSLDDIFTELERENKKMKESGIIDFSDEIDETI